MLGGKTGQPNGTAGGRDGGGGLGGLGGLGGGGEGGGVEGGGVGGEGGLGGLGGRLGGDFGGGLGVTASVSKPRPRASMPRHWSARPNPRQTGARCAYPADMVRGTRQVSK